MSPLNHPTVLRHATSRRILAAAAAAALASSLSADGIKLDATSPSGGTVAVAAPGGNFTVVVKVRSDLPIAFNAALWRLVATEEGCAILDYEWTDPFVTGGPGDFSLGGAPLPLVIEDSTLEGPGYPIQTADVEFGVFDFVESATEGELMRIVLRAPKSATVGSHFFVAAVPDLFTFGFLSIPMTNGVTLRVNVIEAPISSDIDGDGAVDALDLASVLAAWGTKVPPGGLPADVTGDGVVDALDLAQVLSDWTY